MAMPAPSYRYERKFVIPELLSHDTQNMIKTHPAMFMTAYPARFVNNIYCDCFDLKNYFDNINGTSNRIKVRVRWYGRLLGEITRPVLELKIKKAMLGTKQSYSLQPFVLDENFDYNTLAEVFENSDIPENLKMQLSALMPTVLNRYQRRYYRSADRKYRITLDTDMDFYGINNGSNFFVHKRRDRDNIVLELKYDQINDQSAHNIVNHFPFRMLRSSKYLAGIESVVL